MKRWPLAVALLLALVLRLLPAATLTFGTDDGVAWYFSTQFPLRDMVSVMLQAGEVHPPLAFYWIHFWLHWMPASEVWWRLGMILPGVLTVAVVWKWAADMWGEEAAGVAAMTLALSSYHVLACEELRMYPLVALWLSLAGWGLWRRNWVLYIAGATLSLYTYYLSGFVLLSLTPLALKHYPWRGWLLSNVGVALLFAPWLPTVLAQAHGQPFDMREAPPLAWFPELMFQMSYGLTFPRPLAGWSGAHPLDPLKWIGLILPVLGGWLLWKRRDGAASSTWLAGALFIPIGIIAGVSSFTHLRVFEYKYFTMVAPYFALLVGWGAAELRALAWLAIRNSVGLLLVGLNLLSIGLLWQDPDLGQANWRGADNYLLSQVIPDDTVWVMPNMDTPSLQLYQAGRALPRRLLWLNELPPSAPASQLAPNGRLWLVDTCYHPLVQRLQPEAWLEAHGLQPDASMSWQSSNYFPANVIRIQLFAAPGTKP